MAPAPAAARVSGLPRLMPELLGFALLALAVMWWRWGGTIEDSQAYFDTARYLRGELPLSALRAPFPYRLGVPALASIIPFDLRASFAALNWLFVTGSAFVLALTAAHVFDKRTAGWLAGLLVICSFGTFWFAPYLLVDPGSLFARSLFVLGVLLGRSHLAQASGLLAVIIREENILLLVWLLVTRRVAPVRGVCLVAGAALWMVLVRWYLIPGLPPYAWVPSVAQLLHALQDWKSLATMGATAALVLPLAIAGWRKAPPQVAQLKSLVLLLALPALYAMLCVRIDGRVVWGLYPVLIPFAVAYCMHLRRAPAPNATPLNAASPRP